MKYPTLYTRQSDRQMIDTFRGYNHNSRIGDGEFYDMMNLSSDDYPVLSTRKKRGIYGQPQDPQGLISKDGLCYVDGRYFVVNGYPVDMNLSTQPEECPKSLVSMGAYVIIMPDRKWINTLNLTEFGNIDASFSTVADVSFTLCKVDGTDYADVTVSAAQPENPANMALWIDTSATPHTLKQFSSSSAMWVDIATTYIKISSPGIGAAFGQYDGVAVSGIVKEGLQDLNGSFAVWARGDDYIVVTGILDTVVTQTAAEGAVTVERKMPETDFLIESENRLWGCRYGLSANGQVVNEIYASKLGDFKNWNCFMGISTDSYYVSCGTDGRFTGAVTHLGYPLFFKENCVHKVYGNYPANFQVQTTACRGVQAGSHRSLAIVNEILYYKAQGAVCAYDGSLPVEVSQALGSDSYRDAVAGSLDSKYYISMADKDGEYSMFVYDTEKGMWHREDSFQAEAFCSCRNELYAISGGKIVTMLGSGTQDPEDVKWMAQTGDIGLNSPDMKYISRLTLRMAMDSGAELSVFAKYDFSGQWEKVAEISSQSYRSFSLPVRPKRCDHMNLLFVGHGAAKIYSITKTIEQGSELS